MNAGKRPTSRRREREEVPRVSNKAQTSKSVAKKASAIMRDGRSSARSKSVAASALAQTKRGK